MNKNTNNTLKTEHHIHLYGCLDIDDLWEIGRESSKIYEDRLDWFSQEFEKAYGRKPNWKEYWQSDNGKDKMIADFQFKEKAPFNKFQAKFNLIIALCKVVPDDRSIVRRVFTKLRDSGAKYAEARTVLPPYIQVADIDTYLRTITTETKSIESESGGQFLPKLALSVPRETPYTTMCYDVIRKWLDQNEDMADAISAIDVGFYEENDPPKGKKEFISKVLQDNSLKKNKLAILYHVGESFNTISAVSSARWVWEVAQMGVHRLGHAISLGINENELKGRKIIEKAQERLDHLSWLNDNSHWLNESGYSVNPCLVQKEIDSINQQALAEISIEYDDAYLADFQKLQGAIIKHLKHTVNPIIESCPTSNIRIGMISDPKNHPLNEFVKNDLRVCISTDDPGIFDISLSSETEFISNEVGLTKEHIDVISQNEMDYMSSNLV